MEKLEIKIKQKREEWQKEAAERIRSGKEQAEKWNNMDVWWAKMPYGEEEGEEGEEEYED